MPDRFDLVMTGSHVVTGATVDQATIAVAGGRIAALLDPAARPPAAEVINARGLARNVMHVLVTRTAV
ncbi:MAG: hypothetical protein ACKOEC_08175, partial [Acidimicrobiia bacterium]